MVAIISPIYDELLDYLIQKATPQEILAFKASAVAQERANDLIEKNNEGRLSPEESTELEQMLQVDRLVSVLKARALETIHKS
jgi:hypothetical protein